MDQKQPAKRTCPACGSEKYVFRSRKEDPARAGEDPMAILWKRNIAARCANTSGVSVSEGSEMISRSFLCQTFARMNEPQRFIAKMLHRR